MDREIVNSVELLAFLQDLMRAVGARGGSVRNFIQARKNDQTMGALAGVIIGGQATLAPVVLPVRPREVLRLGPRHVHLRSGEVRRDDAHLSYLTTRELEIVEFLLERTGQPVSMQDLMARFWRKEPLDKKGNVVATMHRLRLHLEEEVSRPRYLITVRGFGYRLQYDS